MANTGFISVAPAIAAVAAQITAHRVATDATGVIVVNIHDVDLPAVNDVVDAIRVTDFPTTDALIISEHTDTENLILAEHVATEALINGIGDLSEIEKSYLGIGKFPGFQDFFNTVANLGDPSATNWSVIENGDGAVVVYNTSSTQPGYLHCEGGTTTGNDGVSYTKDKRNISLKNGVTTVHFKSYVRFDWTADNGDNCGIGLIENDLTPTGAFDFRSAANESAAISLIDQVPVSISSDGAVAETTDLSAFITDNVWFLLEIVISVSDVKYYINDTLRATHTTRVPSSVWQIEVASTSVNNLNQKVSAEYVKLGAE